MTAAVLDRPASPAPGAVMGDGVTLEELLNLALHEASTNGGTECPVCHARMSSTRAREGCAAPAAECGGCGSRLS